MLVGKGGIFRNIDEKRLREYLAKGFAPVVEESNTKAHDPDKSDKPIEKMNTEQLKAKAAELGVDISNATTNKQRAEVIMAFLSTQQAHSEEE